MVERRKIIFQQHCGIANPARYNRYAQPILCFRRFCDPRRNLSISDAGNPAPMTTPQSQQNTQAVIVNYVSDLQQYLRSRLSCEEDAKDIAQEACLRMLQFPYATDIENPRAYLYRIASNLLSRHYRHSQVAASGIEADLLPSTHPTTEEQAITHFRQCQLERAIAELSVKCRITMVLRWREGLRVAEIAEHMGLSQGMVKKYLASGMAHARKRLGRFVS